MALVHWHPTRELPSIQSEFDRPFGTFFEPYSPDGRVLAPRRWTPAMDLTENEDGYVVRTDLPGLSESDVSIEVERDVLTVSGERKSESEQTNGGYHRIERSYGSFRRSLRLPEGVDPDSIKAKFENGVLELQIPKPAERKPHRVQISVGTEAPAVEAKTAETAETADAKQAA